MENQPKSIKDYWLKLRDEVLKYKLPQCTSKKDEIQNLFQSIIDYYGYYKCRSSFSFEPEFSSENHYYLDLLFQNLIKIHVNIIDKNKLEIKKDPPTQLDQRFSIYNDIYFKFDFDKNLNFLLEKRFGVEIDKNQIKREKDIFDSKCSAFIVKCIDTENTVIPYFPNGTLYELLHDKFINISLADKLLIILEIGTSLKDLHFRNFYHGCLSSDFIFMNTHKDAFLSNFVYQKEVEENLSIRAATAYYRDPEEINYNDINEFNNERILNDIYSFGILMYEIISGKSPKDFNQKKSKKEILSLLKDNKKYSDFLFDEKNEFIGKDLMSTFKEIITKCISPKKERYAKIDSILTDIKELEIYKENEEEIIYRFNRASESDKNCTLYDVINCFYHGNTKLKERIVNLFNIKEEEDLFDYFIKQGKTDVKSIFLDDYSVYFDDLLNKIIYKYMPAKSHEFKSSDLNVMKELLSLSMENSSNDDEDNLDLIYPISTLMNFAEFDQKYYMLWAYFISRELSVIHSNNMYYGNLNFDKIGIFYNKETKTFVTSLILFYPYCKSSKIINNDENDEDSILKFQQKDRNDLINIISEFNIIPEKNELSNMNSEFNIIPEKNELSNMNSVNDIVNYLYNLNINNEDINRRKCFKENYDKFDYSLFKITFSELSKIAFSLDDRPSILLFEPKKIFYNIHHILMHLNQAKLNSSPQNISELIKEINKNCFNMFLRFSENDDNERKEAKHDGEYLDCSLPESKLIEMESPKIISIIHIQSAQQLRMQLIRRSRSFDHSKMYLIKLTLPNNKVQKISFDDIKGIAENLNWIIYNKSENDSKFTLIVPKTSQK